jgi:hypothetical protein
MLGDQLNQARCGPALGEKAVLERGVEQPVDDRQFFLAGQLARAARNATSNEGVSAVMKERGDPTTNAARIHTEQTGDFYGRAATEDPSHCHVPTILQDF